MINRILLVLFFLSQINAMFSATIDSAKFDDIYKEIMLFKISKQKKYLYAVISSKISKLDNSKFHTDLLKLKYLYIQDLLNNDFNAEALQLLNDMRTIIDLNKPIELWEYYYWFGKAYRFDNKFDSAHFYFDLAINFCLKTKNTNYLGAIYYNKGKTFQREGQHDLANIYYLKADSLIVDDRFALAQSKRRISTFLCLKNKHDEALKYISDAILLYVDTNYVINSRDSIVNFGEYANLLQSRAYVYREMAKGNPDSICLINKSISDAKESILAFEKQNSSLVFESDLIYANLSYKFFYSKTIEAIARLYDATKNDSLLLDALQYAEMDKSSALLRTVQKDIALKQSNIPDSTLANLHTLYKRLSQVEAQRYEENANVRINDSALYDLNLELYNLVSEITTQEKELEKKYPKYANLKYEIKPPNLNFILKESYTKAIVEYVVNGEKLYAFLMVDGRVYFNHYYYRKDFIQSVEKLQQMISEFKKIDFSLEELNEFETLAHNLYNDLLKPFEDKIGNKPLLIVPDEQLSLIPFEVLLTKPVKSKSINYSELPYLVKSNDVSYAYSLTLSHMQNALKKNKKNNELLAMAPGYENLAGNQGKQYIALRNMRDARDKLGMLDGAQVEAKEVSREVKGRLIKKKQATEEQFKLNAPKYDVLHLAMHTLINNDNPLYSKLVFTPDQDKKEDGLLNTYELSNMDLNAELVVLSACNTGFGKLNNGEGIIGLSRGFIQAGCKSLLATLWSVADLASADLINDFYFGILNSETKSASLSQAKRNYLQNSSGIKSHPFFWAGYISIGKDDPIELQKNNNKKTILIFALLLATGVIVFQFYKKKSRK